MRSPGCANVYKPNSPTQRAPWRVDDPHARPARRTRGALTAPPDARPCSNLRSATTTPCAGCSRPFTPSTKASTLPYSYGLPAHDNPTFHGHAYIPPLVSDTTPTLRSHSRLSKAFRVPCPYARDCSKAFAAPSDPCPEYSGTLSPVTSVPTKLLIYRGPNPIIDDGGVLPWHINCAAHRAYAHRLLIQAWRARSIRQYQLVPRDVSWH